MRGTASARAEHNIPSCESERGLRCHTLCFERHGSARGACFSNPDRSTAIASFFLSPSTVNLSLRRCRRGVENRQLIVESTLEGGPRFAPGDIGGEARVFVEDARRT
jgi:hypothetical protein